MKNIEIDINADLGEGAGNDTLIMPYISSCSIAAGGHTGNKTSIKKTLQLAKKHHVKVGVHPSYPDAKNFGRLSLNITPTNLEASLSEQIELFLSISAALKINCHHLKLHGALYNDAAKDEQRAATVLQVIKKYSEIDKIYTLANSQLAQKARESNIIVLAEAFIDRSYNDDGTLVSRTHPKALITQSETAWQQLAQMVINKKINTIQQNTIACDAETFCIHGDTPTALEVLKYIHKQSKPKGINIQ